MAENETPSTEQVANDQANEANEAKPVLNRKLLSETIDIIRQSLQADGGDLALVDCTDDGVVTLEMQGACAGCPLSTYDMSEGIERILKEHVPGVTRVQPAVL
ncbi:NifU-like domain-containing protein [Olsenella sp. KH3B4]|uniref:NifU family protein n=1 Tax=Olsenella sp. KH3B4 TaxID=1855394 RepID=UPI0008B0F1CA|nr:NifU family protein [Olsenella sp. KH3B4]SES85850.1 NifU-like domain-containing protein [Olsenella sp. KH3B4]